MKKLKKYSKFIYIVIIVLTIGFTSMAGNISFIYANNTEDTNEPDTTVANDSKGENVQEEIKDEIIDPEQSSEEEVGRENKNDVDIELDKETAVEGNNATLEKEDSEKTEEKGVNNTLPEKVESYPKRNTIENAKSNRAATDTRYFKFSDNTITGYVTNVPDVSQPAPRDIVIPTSYIQNGVEIEVLKIGDNAFSGLGDYIDSITLNDNLKSIGNQSFSNLKITSMTITSNVESIGSKIFLGCNQLTSVTLQDGVKTIGDSSFYETKLTEITIPSSVTSIGGSAFSNSSSLTKVTLNEGLQIIGGFAFSSTGLKEITIPSSVTSIDRTAFYGCSSLIKATLNEGLKTIGNSAFASTGLKEITIPSSVTSIESAVFSNCSSLTKATLNEGLKTIGNSAFSASGLTEITIPSSVTSIDGSAFSNCRSLTKATFNEGLQIIGNSTFSNTGITEITIPSSVKSIGDNTFSNCSSLKKAILNEGLVTIGASAFFGSGITEITIPSSVTSIDSFAFSNCSSLKKAILNEGLVTIGGSAFSRSGLTEITIPSSVTNIVESAFYGCSSLKKATLNEGLQIIWDSAFSNTGITEITIPSSVTSIMGSAFSRCSSLTKAILNEGLVTIGGSAFSGSGLTEITIPSSVTSIGSSAFSNCSSLTKATLNEGLVTIGESAFSGSGLTKITIPSSVTSIGENSLRAATLEFIDCRKKFNELPKKPWGAVNAKIRYIDTDLYIGHFYYKDGVVLAIKDEPEEGCDNGAIHSGTGELTIPSMINGEKIVKVDDYAFQTKKFEKVIILEGVEDIGQKSFYQCLKLKEVTIPSSTTSIDTYAFSSCSSLIKVTLNEGLKTIGDSAFSDSGLTEITIPSSVTSIGNSAFYNCISLTKATLNEGLVTIGESAFSSSGLTEITIPSSVPSIGNNAFSGCSSLTKATLNEGLKTIVNSAFSASGLTEITIPSSVTSIESSAFSKCRSLTKATFNEGLQIIGNSTFSNTGLTEIKIPSSVKSIGDNTFSNCSSLKKATLNEGLKTMGVNAFSVSGLTEITIPSSVISIGVGAFANCSSLTKAFLNEGLKTIENGTFASSGLTEITIPSSVISIEGSAFANCSSLIKATLNEGLKTIGSYGVSPSGGVFYNTGLTEITIPSSVTSIGNFAFNECKSLSKATLNEGLVTIGSSAFYNTGLTEITIPSSVPSIGGSAFNGCSSLTKVTLNEGLKIIGDSAFSSTGLKEITIPSSVDSIGTNTFSNCSSLTKATLNEGLKTIGEKAFANTNLTTISRIPNSVTYIAIDSFSNTKLRMIVIDKPRDECPYRIDEPWGANNADKTVYYKGEFIEMNYTIEKSGDKRIIHYTFSSSASMGLITKIYFPDGSDTIVSGYTYSGSYEISQNDIFTFRPVSGSNIEFIYDVSINDIGAVTLTGNDFLIRKNALQNTATLEELLAYGSVKGTDNDTNKNLEVKADKTLKEIQDALVNQNDSINVVISAENDYGTKVNKTIKITLDDTSHIVTFYDGDSILKKVSIDENEVLANWIPTSAYGTFEKWYADKKLETEWNFSNKVTEDVSLYAGWNYILYDVAYNSKFSDVKIETKNDVKLIDDELLPEEPSKLGYSLDKWTYKTTLVGKQTKLSELITDEAVGSTIVLDANWIKNSYTIQYDTKFDDIIIPNKDNVDIDSNQLLPTEPKKQGFEFDGWYYRDQKVSNSNILSDIMDVEPSNRILVLQAKWIANTYTIAYDTKFGDIRIEPKTGVTIKDSKLIPNKMEKDGYVFHGWTYQGKKITSNTALEEFYQGALKGTTFTLEAVWEKDMYFVDFAFIGKAPIDRPESQMVAYKDHVSKPSVKASNQWTFSGWYSDEACTKLYDFQTEIMGTMVLYGKWTYMEIPVVPEKPENPDIPVEPEKPENPDIPVKPEKPENPNVPIEPEKPVIPDDDITTIIDGKLEEEDVKNGIHNDNLKDMITFKGKDGNEVSYVINSGRYNKDKGVYTVSVTLDTGEVREVDIPVDGSYDSKDCSVWFHWIMYISILLYIIYSICSYIRAKKKEMISKKTLILRYTLSVLTLAIITLVYVISDANIAVWMYIPSVIIIFFIVGCFIVQKNRLDRIEDEEQ